MAGNARKFFKGCFLAVCIVFGFFYAADVVKEVKEVFVDREIYFTFKAAEEGNADAQMRLAGLYQAGSPSSQKLTEFYQAASPFNLKLTEDQRNKKESIYWFTRAAQSGSKTASMILCNDYKIGCDK